MVQRTRKIVWTSFAKESKYAIFLYWNQRNKSTSYSRKLNVLLQESLKQIVKFPESAIESNNSNVRLKILSHFELIYQITNTQIVVLDI
ncbi:type II toxin-antitoxin system RelE/ParE family toxin [Flavobacterium circumlabens]|uniref:Toxin YoeB n=1 Tax=Flavobacterium circumlabens TaxID=2133765 RepID=A0A4Y7UDE9_9FLAO|nr:toxin YoeB [Flavobacterium circumlabens]TEB44028.1 type II toxin-antitoxin system RelE/ParE family toxin [Flavobacterium circumlabens]